MVLVEKRIDRIECRTEKQTHSVTDTYLSTRVPSTYVEGIWVHPKMINSEKYLKRKYLSSVENVMSKNAKKQKEFGFEKYLKVKLPII